MGRGFRVDRVMVVVVVRMGAWWIRLWVRWENSLGYLDGRSLLLVRSLPVLVVRVARREPARFQVV